MLEWLYTGQCVVEHTALLDLLAAAGRLRVEPLQEAATWSIIGNVLTDATCLDIWDAARRLAVPELEYAARRFASEHFEAVTASVGSLPSDVLAEMLTSDDLACSREEQVLDALMRWARIHKPSAASLAELLRHVRFDRFADASSAAKTANEPLFASTPCLSVIAVKLAAQLDPAGERSSRRKGEMELLSRSAPDSMSLMRKIAGINREAAEFAMDVENHLTLTADPQLVGPLLMYLQVRKGFLSKHLLAKLENTLASGFLKVATGTHPNCRPSVTIYDGRDAAAYDAEEVAKYRPPARELERYLRHQILLPDVNKDARLAWLDEIFDFHDSELSRAASTASGLTVERLRAQIEGVLRDKFHSVATLVCTHDLPSVIIGQLLQHVQQHEAATHAHKGLSGLAGAHAAAAHTPRLAAIVMPCQVIRFNVTPSHAASIGGTGTPFSDPWDTILRR